MPRASYYANTGRDGSAGPTRPAILGPASNSAGPSVETETPRFEASAKVLVGHTGRGRLEQLLRGSIVDRFVKEVGDIGPVLGSVSYAAN